MSLAKDEYIKLLIKLDELDKKGMNNSDEADEIRDEMDKYWYQLTDKEYAYVKNYSTQLYKERESI